MAKAKEKKEKQPKQKKQSSGENFLLLHGEKFVFGIFVILAVWLMTRGSGLAPFTLTPDQVRDAASRAENNIRQSKVEPKDVDADLNIYNYLDYASLIKSSLRADAYETDNRWEQSLFPEKILRPAIRPLAVENLRAVACIGAIRYTKMSAATGMAAQTFEDRGEHWITVTGLIPIADQMKEYNDVLGRSEYTDPNRDVPKYVFYDIFRGVVDESGNTVWDEKPIDLNQVYAKEIDQWAGFGLDPVSTEYSVPLFSMDSPSLTMECPPLVNKSFGSEVTNLPNIPLLSETQKEELADQMSEMKKQEDATKKGNTRNFNSVLSTSIFSQGGNARGANTRTGGPLPGMPNMMPVQTPNMMPNAARGGNAAGIGAKVTKVNYYLFRFFDFDVEEGRTYQYKVKLYLANPNYGLDVNLVEDGNSVLTPAVASGESKPSNPVSLGSESRILAESIEAGRLGQEPKITVASIYFNTEDAKESLNEGAKVVLGQVANFANQDYKPINLGGSMTYTTAADADTGKKKVDHLSNICILDADGGEKISGSELRSSARLLVLEPSGLLSFHSASEDKAELLPYMMASPRR